MDTTDEPDKGPQDPCEAQAPDEPCRDRGQGPLGLKKQRSEERIKSTSNVVNQMISDILDDGQSSSASNDQANSKSQPNSRKDSKIIAENTEEAKDKCEVQESSYYDFQSFQDPADITSVKFQIGEGPQDMDTQHNFLGPNADLVIPMDQKLAQHSDRKSFMSHNEQHSFMSYMDDSQNISCNLQQIDSFYGQHQADSILGTQNNNSYYKNEFQEYPSFTIPGGQDHYTNQKSKQPLMVVGMQNLPLNPILEQFNEQSYYKLRQKELTGALTAQKSHPAQMIREQAKQTKTENIDQLGQSEKNTISSFKDEKDPQDLQKSSQKSTWSSNHWNQKPAQYNVHYSQKEFEDEFSQKQSLLSNRGSNDFSKQNIIENPKSMVTSSDQIIERSPTSGFNPEQTSKGPDPCGLQIEPSGSSSEQEKQPVDPIKSYEAQHFQNQNLMLNRDPEFLLKQHMIQQKLIKQYHLDKTKQIALKVAKHAQIDSKTQDSIKKDENSAKQTTRTFKEILYGNLGYIQQETPNEDSQRPLMFEKKPSMSQDKKQENAANPKQGENASDTALGQQFNENSLLAASFDNQNLDRAYSERNKSLSEIQQNDDAYQGQQNQSFNYQDKPQLDYTQDLQNQFKSYEPQEPHQFPSYDDNIDQDHQKPSSLDLAFDENDHNKSKRSIFSGDFGTYTGDNFEDKRAQDASDWKSQQDVSKDSFSRESTVLTPGLQLGNEFQEHRQMSTKNLSFSGQKFTQNGDSETKTQSKPPIGTDAHEISDAKSQQYYHMGDIQRFSTDQQDSSLKAQDNNGDPQNRFSNFSDSVTKMKRQKPSSVYDQSDNRSSHTSNLCSSVDPKEVDNLEQMIQNDLNFLQNIQSQSNELTSRIGQIINKQLYSQGYDQQTYNQGLMYQQQLQMQYGGQLQAQNQQQQVTIAQNMPQYQTQGIQNNQRPHYGIPHQQQPPRHNPNYMMPGLPQPQNQNYMQSPAQQMSPHQFSQTPQSSQLNHQSSSFIPKDAQQQYTLAETAQQQSLQQQQCGNGRKAAQRHIEKIHQMLQQQKNNKVCDLSLEVTRGFELDCCKDQKCSRFIQKKLVDESTTISERSRFLDSILKNDQVRFDNLVMDSFGNYVIQKIQQIPGIETQYLNIIFENIIGKVMKYSTHKHGCRVVQTGFEVFQFDQKLKMMQELIQNNSIKECSFNFNGNHVVQQILIVMGSHTQCQQIKDIIKVIDTHLIEYCVNEYCCRIIQRMVEYCHPSLIENTNIIILSNFFELSKNEFGIFVLSSILEHGQYLYIEQILQKVLGNAAQMSLRKDGSKLVENCVKMIHKIGKGKHEQQASLLYQILDELIYLPQNQQEAYGNHKNLVLFTDLLTNKFANYVVQAAFEVSDQQRKQVILGKIQTSMKNLSNFKDTPLKHILKFLQKHDIYHRGNQLYYGQNSNAMVQPYSSMSKPAPNMNEYAPQYAQPGQVMQQESFHQAQPMMAPAQFIGQPMGYSQPQYPIVNPNPQFNAGAQMMFNNPQPMPYQMNSFPQQVPQMQSNETQINPQYVPQLQQMQQFYNPLGGVAPQQAQQSLIQNQQQQLMNQFNMLSLQNTGGTPQPSQSNQQNVNNYHY